MKLPLSFDASFALHYGLSFVDAKIIDIVENKILTSDLPPSSGAWPAFFIHFGRLLMKNQYVPAHDQEIEQGAWNDEKAGFTS